jgi:hypothetical protein
MFAPYLSKEEDSLLRKGLFLLLLFCREIVSGNNAQHSEDPG